MTEWIDRAVVAATQCAALRLEADIAAFGLGNVGEVKHLKPAFRDALKATGLRDVRGSEEKVSFASWEPPGVKGRLGSVDVIVGASPHYRAFFELKWASGKRELGWTLWDIYKLAAGCLEHRVDAYAIVGAPLSYWKDSSVDCSALYCDSTWESWSVFSRYERAWADLLRGGTARPRRVPACITTRLLVSQPLEVDPRWELRALRVDAVDGAWLDFVGDWPVGHRLGGTDGHGL